MMKPSLFVESRKRAQISLPAERSKTNFQVRSEKAKFFLSKEEEKVYGERFPIGYKKLKVLGRGGCALV